MAAQPKRTPLRAVPADGAVEQVSHATPVSDAARRSTKDLLVATRDRIALAVDDPGTPARDLAALTKRLVDVSREIEAIVAREREEAERVRKERERKKSDAEAFDPEAV